MRISDWSSDVCSSDLLQVMDHVTLTDNNGRKADFRNIILVMTTNAGAEESARRSVGFTEQNHTTDAIEVMRKMFTPEFRNRLDAIVQFAPLERREILRVVDKRSEEHTSELQSLMRISYAVFCLTQKNKYKHTQHAKTQTK